MPTPVLPGALGAIPIHLAVEWLGAKTGRSYRTSYLIVLLGSIGIMALEGCILTPLAQKRAVHLPPAHWGW